ncbi:MAG: galactokinase [Bacteroidales bacterium]|nr:galactokinase [Bacteroidales bacterium]MCF8390804.1 galactokinase [Bacteroidales bacterium]
MKSNELIHEFEKIYGYSNVNIRVFFSPGRVNLIGEHTDYNGGYVFPCALDFGTQLVIRKNNLNVFRFATTNFEDKGEIVVSSRLTKHGNHWYNYPLAVIDQFNKKGHIFEGMDFLFSGEIPNGAGLSSSASVETVTAYALNEMYAMNYDRWDLVKLSQKAENEFVGVNCGIMDQFAVMMGKENHALFLNCATLDYDTVPLKMDGHKLIISNTNKKRGLADSKYNERRSECETAVDMLSVKKPIENLSVLNYAEYMDMKELISDQLVFRRAKHVITENNRVLEAIVALKNNELGRFGDLMNQSHDSLKNDYEVTGKELDVLVEEARKLDGVLGSRMTGAGFGGCTVSLVREDVVDEFKIIVGKAYFDRTGLIPEFYVAAVGEGTREV